MARSRGGVTLLVVSAAAFGTSGAFARALIDAGWSPGAAVLVRITGATLVLAAALVAVRRAQLRAVLRSRGRVLLYGLVAVAGVQVCYFTAIRTLSVAVALLLEYLAPVLVIAWVWARTGRRPAARTLGGGALALVGTVGVLDVVGGARVDPVGVLWALGAAVCLACYFVVLGGEDDGDAVEPVVLAGAGMVVGAAAVTAAAAVGALPVAVGAPTTTLLHHAVPAWGPLAGLVLVSTVLAYATGAAGVARVGAAAASLVSLSEVLFAALAAWALLGQRPSPVQAAGAALVVTGVVLTQTGRRAPGGPAGAPGGAPVGALPAPADLATSPHAS